jgi:hypothetical protein
MEKKHFTLLEFILILTAGGLLFICSSTIIANNLKIAKGEKCRASLGQLGAGIMAYTYDFDEVLPPSVIYSNPKKLGCLPQQFLTKLQYTERKTMRNGCPEYPQKVPKYANICGYAYNAYLGMVMHDGSIGNRKLWFKSFPVTKISQVKNPNKKIIMSDTYNYMWLGYFSGGKYNDWRHGNGSNFLNFDGTVKYHSRTFFKFDSNRWDKSNKKEIEKYLWPY